MKVPLKGWSLVLLAFGALLPGAALHSKFPQVQLRPLTLLGIWESAPMVVVGDVRNVEAVGSQQVERLAWPAPRTVRRIYWCEGDFFASAVIKGHGPPAGMKFLWGTAKPGCELYSQPHDGSPVIRVWFIREEGNYLRPVVDGFGLYYITSRVRWEEGSKLDPKTQFARLLLNPKVSGEALKDYVQEFSTYAGTACYILGREQCTEQIRALEGLGDAELRRAACGFLSSQYQEGCQP